VRNRDRGQREREREIWQGTERECVCVREYEMGGREKGAVINTERERGEER
jgi:hypothetical protein